MRESGWVMMLAEPMHVIIVGPGFGCEIWMDTQWIHYARASTMLCRTNARLSYQIPSSTYVSALKPLL